MSNTPMTQGEDQTKPIIDIQNPDALIDHLNERAEANRADTEKREAVKAAHKAKVLRAKRRNWFAGLLHWITHICGLLCIAYTLRDYGCPDALWGLVVAATALAIVFWMPGIVKGFPKK